MGFINFKVLWILKALWIVLSETINIDNFATKKQQQNIQNALSILP